MKPDRVIENEVTGDKMYEWQKDGLYFEIEKISEENIYEIMIEVKEGEFEHWVLKKY